MELDKHLSILSRPSSRPPPIHDGKAYSYTKDKEKRQNDRDYLVWTVFERDQHCDLETKGGDTLLEEGDYCIRSRCRRRCACSEACLCVVLAWSEQCIGETYARRISDVGHDCYAEAD